MSLKEHGLNEQSLVLCNSTKVNCVQATTCVIRLWQYSRSQGSSAVHGPVYYSTTARVYIANKAAQKIYNKHNLQVVARWNS